MTLIYEYDNGVRFINTEGVFDVPALNVYIPEWGELIGEHGAGIYFEITDAVTYHLTVWQPDVWKPKFECELITAFDDVDLYTFETSTVTDILDHITMNGFDIGSIGRLDWDPDIWNQNLGRAFNHLVFTGRI